MKILNHKYLELLPNLSEDRTQKFTSVIFTLIALSILGLFAINPTLSTIAKIRKEITDYEVISQKLEQKIVSLATLQQAYSRLEYDFEAVLESIPQSPLVPLFIGQVQAVAKDSNIHLTQLHSSSVDLFKENEAPKKYYFYSFSLNAEGTYQNFLKFMENITNMQRVVNVDILSVSKAGAGGALQINLQGVTYYKK